MVSVLCPASRHLVDMPPSVDYPVLYPPPPLPLSRPHMHPQPPPPPSSNKFQSAYYAKSTPQRSNSTANALHLRSQSVPEAVYLEQQQQIGLPVVLQRGSPTKQLRVMHYGLHQGHQGHHLHHHHPPPPPLPLPAQQGGLRRSHTNATEFAASRRRFQSGAAKLGVSYMVQQRQFGSNQHLNHLNVELNSFFPPAPPLPPMPPPPAAPLPGHLAGFQPEDAAAPPRSYIQHQQQQRGCHPLSRSRSNVASLRPNPPHQQQPFQLHHNPLYTRSTSHLFRQGEFEFSRQGESAFSTSRGSGSLQMLLLQQPLHVDCSIEYDLGKQPLIPKGSEPLLIVDPTYGSRRRDDQLTRSAPPPPLSLLSSPRPFAEGIVAPSKTSTPKGKEAAAAVGRRASFLEERSSRAPPPRRPKGMSVKEEEEENEEEEVTTAGHRQRHLQRESEQRKGFHLSMPEIALGEDDDGDQDNNRSNRQHHHHRHHRHHHHHHRRCRTETESSGSRKVSSESSSGMDSGAGSTSSMFQRFSQLKGAKFKPISPAGGGQNQNNQSGGNLQRSQACDSGLGTPSSQSILKSTSAASARMAAASLRTVEDEEREIQVIQFVRHQLKEEERSATTMEAAGNGNGNRSGAGSSKWKSSVTGLMSGIFCCSGRQDDPAAAVSASFDNGAVLSGVARYEVNAVADVISGAAAVENSAVSPDSDCFPESGTRFPGSGSGFPEGGFPHQPQQHRHFWLHPSSRPPPPPPPPALPDVVGHSAVVATASSQQHPLSPEASSRPFWSSEDPASSADEESVNTRTASSSSNSSSSISVGSPARASSTSSSAGSSLQSFSPIPFSGKPFSGKPQPFSGKLESFSGKQPSDQLRQIPMKPRRTTLQQQHRRPSSSFCTTCRTASADCSDGFCVSVWSNGDKATNGGSDLFAMRPIHI